MSNSIIIKVTLVIIIILNKNNKVSLINRMKFKNFYLRLNNNSWKNRRKKISMIKSQLMSIDQYTVFNLQKISIKMND